MRRAVVESNSWKHRACAATMSVRAVQQGGRRSRFNGGSGDPTKDVIISQGSEEVPRLRSPGSAKMVRVTNKAGRVFNVSIPISKLTHPQKKLISPINGKWMELDTSYADVGDVDEDAPTHMDELAAQGSTADVLRDELRQMCLEYIAMDTDGMVNHPQISEKNTGPDYEDEDRKTKRRRMWFSIRHRFEDLRTVLWPEPVEAQPQRVAKGGRRQSSAGHASGQEADIALQLYDTLSALAAASTFGVYKKAPYEDRPSSDYEPLDLQREVRVTCQALYRAGDSASMFGAGDVGAQRLTTMAALCASHRVAFETCFVGAAAVDTAQGGTAAKFLLEAIPTGAGAAHSAGLPQKLANGLLRVLSNMQLDVSSWSTDPQEQLLHLQRVDALLGCCTRGAAGDALSAFDGDDVVSILQAIVRIRRDNTAIFKAAKQQHPDAIGLQHFCNAFQTHVAVVLARCSALLYHKQGDAQLSSIMSEDVYVPMVDLQAHADRQHSGIVVHNKIGRTHAQGLRHVTLHAMHAARIVGLMQELRACDSAAVALPGTSHLQADLLMHVSTTLGGGNAKLLSMNDLITTLEAVGTQLVDCGGGGGQQSNVWRINRILSIVDQRVASLLHEVKDLAMLARLVQAFAACRCTPSCLKRIEPVALRLVSLAVSAPSAETLRSAATMCDGLARLGNPNRRSMYVLMPQEATAPVSPALLDRCARAVDVYLLEHQKPLHKQQSALAAAVPLLIALARGQYDNVGGLTMKHLNSVVAMVADATSFSAITPLVSLLVIAHRSGGEAGADADTLQRLIDVAKSALLRATKALSTLPDPWSPQHASLVVELAASSMYLAENGTDEAEVNAATSALPSTALWKSFTLPEVVALHVAFPTTSGDCVVLRDALQATKGALCSSHTEKEAVSSRASEKSSRPFNIRDLDHCVHMPDVVPRSEWSDARWASIVLLRRISTIADAEVQTLAAELLGAYMQRIVAALGHASAEGAVGSSFELNHARREEVLSELEADLQQCASVLEGCGLLHIAEAQYAAEEERPNSTLVK